MQREHSVENFKITLHLRHATHACTYNNKLQVDCSVCVHAKCIGYINYEDIKEREQRFF